MVVPVITWEGLNPVDDDLDGFADTLKTSRSVPLRRPFVRGAAPRPLTTEAAPLLRFLDRKRLPYDLTTDVSLDQTGLGDTPGVALAGGARWLTRGIQRALRRHVEGGGRVASFGGDALRRSVQLRAGAASEPHGAGQGELARRANAARAGRSATPLTVQEDGLDLFAGAGYLGDFSLFDLSTGGPETGRHGGARARSPCLRRLPARARAWS